MAPSRPADVDAGRVLYEALLKAQSGALEVVYTEGLELQVPPEGNFDFTDLIWTRLVALVGVERRRETVLTARIPWAALERFLLGETERCNIDKWVAFGRSKDGWYCQYKCACHGDPEPVVYGPREEHARGPARIASKKVGCTARFTVTRESENLGSTALVRYLRHEHVDACRVQSPRGVSQEAKDFALAQLDANPELSALKLVEKNAARVAQRYAEEHNITKEAAIALFTQVRGTAARAARGGAALRRGARARVPLRRAPC
jgi:hypothetical protein